MGCRNRAQSGHRGGGGSCWGRACTNVNSAPGLVPALVCAPPLSPAALQRLRGLSHCLLVFVSMSPILALCLHLSPPFSPPHLPAPAPVPALVTFVKLGPGNFTKVNLHLYRKFTHVTTCLLNTVSYPVACVALLSV